MRRQVKEFRVAAAVIPALKDKSIERDFRTLKRDRLVADIPMWSICFLFNRQISESREQTRRKMTLAVKIGWHHDHIRPGMA